jgi:hypothetical protein
MLQPTLVPLLDVGLYTPDVQPLRLFELGEALNMLLFVRNKVTG